MLDAPPLDRLPMPARAVLVFEPYQETAQAIQDGYLAGVEDGRRVAQKEARQDGYDLGLAVGGQVGFEWGLAVGAFAAGLIAALIAVTTS